MAWSALEIVLFNCVTRPDPFVSFKVSFSFAVVPESWESKELIRATSTFERIAWLELMIVFRVRKQSTQFVRVQHTYGMVKCGEQFFCSLALHCSGCHIVYLCFQILQCGKEVLDVFQNFICLS